MKKPKLFVLFSLIILLIGGIIWLILALVNHWDIIGFFSSNGAIGMYCILGFYTIICGFVLLTGRDNL